MSNVSFTFVMQNNSYFWLWTQSIITKHGSHINFSCT